MPTINDNISIPTTTSSLPSHQKISIPLFSSCTVTRGTTQKTTTILTPNTHLLLRPAYHSDADALFPIFSDATVMKYWSEPPHSNPERTRKWVDGMIASGQNGVTDFVIAMNETSSSASSSSPSSSTSTPIPSTTAGASTHSVGVSINGSDIVSYGTAIGKIGIYAPPPSNEIGFLLARQHWGKGLGYEALSCMLEYLFMLPASESLEKRNRMVVHSAHGDDDEKSSNVDDSRNSEEVPQQQRERETEHKREEEADEEQKKQRKKEKEKEQERLTTLSSEERASPWRYASITADVDPRNAACVALLKKAGFAQHGYLEKTWCVAETWVDSVYLKLEREEWLRKRRNEEVRGER